MEKFSLRLFMVSLLYGTRISPRPLPVIGVSYIKNGQSLPNCAAYVASLSCESFSPNSLLSALSVHAASAEPPPIPAPTGIPLYRCISTGGRLKSLSSSLYALTQRSFSGFSSFSGYGFPYLLKENTSDSVISRTSLKLSTG